MTQIGIICTQVLQQDNIQISDQLSGARNILKKLRNLNEKLRAKLPATTHCYSMGKFACLDDAFSELVFELETSPIEGQSLQQTDKREQGKAQKRNEKT